MKVVHGPFWLTDIEWHYSPLCSDFNYSPVCYKSCTATTKASFVLTVHHSYLTLFTHPERDDIYDLADIVRSGLNKLGDKWSWGILDGHRIVLTGEFPQTIQHFDRIRLLVIRKLRQASA